VSIEPDYWKISGKIVEEIFLKHYHYLTTHGYPHHEELPAMKSDDLVDFVNFVWDLLIGFDVWISRNKDETFQYNHSYLDVGTVAFAKDGNF
jgi:hypothetical protein